MISNHRLMYRCGGNKHEYRVKINEVFPTGNILAIGEVHLQTSNIVAIVYLKFDDPSSGYKLEFPSASVGHEFTQECNGDLLEKLLYAMVWYASMKNTSLLKLMRM